MKIKNPFIEEYGLGIRGLSNLGIGAAILGLLAIFVAMFWGAWMIWGNHNACSPPNHLVYAYTKDVLVGNVLVPKDYYYCEP